MNNVDNVDSVETVETTAPVLLCVGGRNYSTLCYYVWVVETGQFSVRSSHTWSVGLHYTTLLTVHYSRVTSITLGLT